MAERQISDYLQAQIVLDQLIERADLALLVFGREPSLVNEQQLRVALDARRDAFRIFVEAQADHWQSVWHDRVSNVEDLARQNGQRLDRHALRLDKHSLRLTTLEQIDRRRQASPRRQTPAPDADGEQ